MSQGAGLMIELEEDPGHGGIGTLRIGFPNSVAQEGLVYFLI